jgi:hypothetical protein
VDNDRIRGKGSGSDGTGSFVEPVRGADTFEGKDTIEEGSLKWKSSGEEKQKGTKDSSNKDHN